jgi:hypothetical protein
MRMAVVCEDYPEIQIFRENFVIMQQDEGFVEDLPDNGFTPKVHRYVLEKGKSL